MAKLYERLKVDIQKKIPDIAVVKDDTNSRYLDVILYANGSPIDLTGHIVKLSMEKYDGTRVFNNGAVTDAKKGRCQFLLTAQAIAVVGPNKAQITIWNDNTTILSSFVFTIWVTESLYSSDSIQSTNEFGALVVAFQEWQQAKDQLTNILSNFGTPTSISTSRGISSLWGSEEYIMKYLDTTVKKELDEIKTLCVDTSIQAVKDLIGSPSDATTGTLFGNLNQTVLRAEKIQVLNSSREYGNTQSAVYINLFSYTGSGRLYGILSSATVKAIQGADCVGGNLEFFLEVDNEKIAKLDVVQVPDKTATHIVQFNVWDALRGYERQKLEYVEDGYDNYIQIDHYRTFGVPYAEGFRGGSGPYVYKNEYNGYVGYIPFAKQIKLWARFTNATGHTGTAKFEWQVYYATDEVAQ